jgi:hypothetical protein
MRMSNSILLVALLFLLVAEPFFPEETFGHAVYLILISAVLIAAVWAASRHQSLRVASLLLAFPTFVVAWVRHFVDDRTLSILFLLLATAFFVFTAVVVVRQALGRDISVTVDTIAGAVCVYLLLAVIWALFFSCLELAHPGSFLTGGQMLASSSRHRTVSPELLYLSLVTLSTLGYGDVLPFTSQARMLASIEAIIGQLYLAVLIARLVGIEASRPRTRGPAGG